METAAQTVLVVEDEPKLGSLLLDYLSAAGYQAHWLSNGLEVLPWVQANTPSLILLDLMLPGKDGLTICKALRTFSDVPIVIVTARVEEVDRLLGLELGADDYICKPFSPREVMARIKAIMRRTVRRDAVAEHAMRIDEERCQVRIGEQCLDLTPIELRLLKTLAAAPGKVFSRSQLLDNLYADYRVVTDRTVDTHVKNLRRKLESISPEGDLIHSVYGVGYKLEI